MQLNHPSTVIIYLLLVPIQYQFIFPLINHLYNL